MLLGIAEPGAEQILLLLPKYFPSAGIERDDAIIFGQILATTLQQALGMLGELVEAVDTPIARDDAVVQEAVTVPS